MWLDNVPQNNFIRKIPHLMKLLRTYILGAQYVFVAYVLKNSVANWKLYKVLLISAKHFLRHGDQYMRKFEKFDFS